MAREEHLNVLARGVLDWNAWRRAEPGIEPDLSRADLSERELFEFLGEKKIDEYVVEPHYEGVNFKYTNLAHTKLQQSSLNYADLTGSHLYEANLRGADLSFANLTVANLTGADLTSATVGWTTFVGNDFRKVKGLSNVRHYGPSHLGIDSLYLSAGDIPESFLRGCGMTNEFIAYLPSLIGAEQVIQYYSCFISHSHKDEEFCQRLHSRMRDSGLRVWFAPEDMKAGQKLFEQIDQAIQLHDRLLIVLSENSLGSEWVQTEVRKARRIEISENRRKLFPIRLVDYENVKNWECVDADLGKDLAIEVREYFIPDFSNWKDHDSFERAFKKLLRDLKSNIPGAEEDVQ